jgi:transposase-like protein
LSTVKEHKENIFGGVFLMNEIEKAYWNHEVSKQLDIGESTLRKWCIELEESGYLFIKGSKGSRAFTDHDIAALMHFRNLTRAKNHTMKQAAMAVVEKFLRDGKNEIAPPVLSENTHSIQNIEKMLTEVLEQNKKQEEFNKALLKKLEQQEKYIKESIEKRDQLLLENIRANQEQAAALEKKKITNRLKRLFRLN